MVINKKKSWVLITAFAILLSFCHSVNKHKTARAIWLTTQFCMIDSNGATPLWRDTVAIAKQDDLNIILLPTTDSLPIIVDTNGVNQSLFSFGVKKIEKFFVYKTGQINAQYYDYSKDSLVQLLPTDSLLKMYTYSEVKFYSTSTDSLISKTYDGEKGLGIKTFIKTNAVKNNPGFQDTIYIYYGKGFENAPFSFAPLQDTFNFLKAYKIVGINESTPVRIQNTIKNAKLESSFEISPMSKQEVKKLYPLFQKFKTLP